MISFEWDKKSLSSFENKMNRIVNRFASSAKKGIENASNNVQEEALKNKRGSKNKDMIPLEVRDLNTGEIIGRIHTDKNLLSHACFLEFGTGVKADGTMEHIGETRTFIESGMQYWFLPVEKIDRKLNNQIIVINDTEFYLMFATKPYPFMRPAAFSTRDDSVKLVKESIKNLMEGILK